MLTAGELPLARAYVDASAEARPAIVATYEWQHLVTSLLFDVFGFCMLSVWILASSLAGLHSGRLPKGLVWFGTATGVLGASFAAGFVTRLSWLGESGIGQYLAARRSPCHWRWTRTDCRSVCRRWDDGGTTSGYWRLPSCWQR
jgi:hypothetical protein